MLAEHLFRFGYEIPSQVERNVQHGWDDEDSAGVWIVGASADQAMEWGRVIAEKFVLSLFAQSSDAYLWTVKGFAHWIEDDPEVLAAARHLPIVAVGEIPDFGAMLSKT